MADLTATLAPDQWAGILRRLENAVVENAVVLDRLHMQFGRLAPEHGCSWPGLQRSSPAHRDMLHGDPPRHVCSCGMPWPHVDLSRWD